MAVKLISLRAYAEHKGVSLKAVQKAIQSGRIQTEKNGKIDRDKADHLWRETTDPSKQRGNSSHASESYQQARAAREAYNAKLAKLNYETRASHLVDASMVRLRAFENARMVRDNLLNIANRISAELASETDPVKIGNMLTLEITRALEEFDGIREAKAREAASSKSQENAPPSDEDIDE